MSRTVAWSIGVWLALLPPANAQFVEGDLYVGAWQNTIYRVEPATWNVTVFADASDGLNGVSAIAFSPSDTLLCSNYYPDQVVEFDAAGNGSILHDKSSGLFGPFGANGLAYDAGGNLFVGDYIGLQILLFPTGGGAPSVFADVSDGILNPDGLAFAANGDLFVADRSAFQVLRIDPSGNTTLFDSLPSDPYSIVIRGNGDIYVACYASASNPIYRYPGGDVTQRTLFASPAGSGGNPSLQFSPDQSVLYFTSYNTSNLVVIDPDTAFSTEVIPGGGLPGAVSIGVFGSRPQASWSNYGAGFPGTNGIPSFTSQQNPVLGTTITLDLMNSYAQPTAGLLVVGFQQTALHSSWGGDLLVVPALVIPITFSFGFDSFTGDIPLDYHLVGLAVDLQALEIDPGAAKGVSFTPGLELVLGY